MAYPANYWGPAGGKPAMTEGQREAWRNDARGGADPSSGYFDGDGNWHLYAGGGGGAGGGDDDGTAEAGAIDWEKLASDREHWQAQIALERERMERLGIPELEIRRRLADLQEQQFRSELGLRYLQAAAQMGGPSDWFQAVNFYRGARTQQNIPVFLQSLLNNTGMPAFNGPGSQAPSPQTAASLIGALGGAPAPNAPAPNAAPPNPVAPSSLPDTGPALNAIRQVHERGAHQLGLGTLENLTPEEAALFASGVKEIGGSMPSFLQQYQRSRPQQRASRGTSLGYAA